MKNRAKNTVPIKLLKQHRKPPTRPSETGYANSTVYSKNKGAKQNEKTIPPVTEAYNCQVLKDEDK